MPDRERIKNGFNFEKSIASILDGRLVPGSGNQWYSQGDISAHGIRLSCKATAKRTWKETRNQLDEAIDFSQSTGEIPALAIEDDDREQLIVMRVLDFARAISGDISIPADSGLSKGAIRRAQAKIPVLLRKEE